MTIYTDTIQQMYVAYFNRPADVSGLANWEAYAAGKSLADLKKAISTEFAKSAEYTIVFQGMTTSQIVTKVYQNLLGREPDAPGLINWINHLADGSSTISSLVTDIIRDAGAGDVDTLANKLSAAKSFTGALDTVAKINAYSGAAANKVAADWLATVGQTAASLTTATSKLADAVSGVIDNSGANVGSTFTLTTGTDSGAAFTGGAGNDTFNATGKTLTALDALNGGAGTDKLVIQDADSLLNTTVPSGLQLTSIEKVLVTSAGSVGSVASAGSAGVPAVKQIDTVTIVGTDGGGEAFTVVYGGVTLTTAAVTTDGAALTAVANAINAIAGATIANVIGGDVVITGPAAGVALPAYSVTGAVLGAVAPVTQQSAAAAIDAVPAATNIVFDVSGFADLQEMKVDNAKNVNLKVGSTTDAVISGVKNAVVVEGGKTQTVNLTDAASITLTKSAGAVNVTHAKQTAAINIDDGTNVTVNATATTSSGAIIIGNANKPTGAVSVTQNLNADGTATLNGGAVTVNGGSTVNVTVNSVKNAKSQTANNGIANGAITVNAGSATTDVTVTQNSTVTQFTKVGTPVVKETSVVTFKAMTSGEALTFNGLTFTAAKDLTAAQVAAAFSNLTAADTQTSGGPTANGTYTGAFNTAVWTSGAANGAVVTFTAQDESETSFTFSGTAVTNNAGAHAPTNVETAGTAVVNDVKSTGGVTAGAVAVHDGATATIKTVTLDGYNTADLGNSSGDLNALTTLSLANSAGAATVKTTSTALGLNLNNVKNGVTLTAANLKTLNVTTSGKDSSFALAANAVEDLTVAGTKKATFTADLVALKTVKVTGSAGLVLSGNEANTLTSVDTTGTTGAVSATIDATAATYKGGAGVDTVTLTTGTALTKSVDLGDGDDTLILGSAVASSTATLSGGNGTDTLSMTVARADALDATTQTFYTNFERLLLNNAFGTDDGNDDALTLNLANLGFTNYVTTSGTVFGTAGNAGHNDALTLDNLANNGTVALTAKGLITAVVKDAADVANTSDIVNVIANVGAANVDFGKFTVANVETVNLSASDTVADDNGDGTITTAEAVPEKTTLILTADSAKTVNITGSAKVDLTLTGSTKVTLIDGSTMSAALNVTSVNTTDAVTIKGGAGDDTLVSANTSTQADELRGGAGKDSLTANKGMTKMYGGDGADTFNITVASTNVNSASSIMDLGSGDVIKFASADAFKSAAVSLDSTAVFQDFANAAIAAITSDNDLAWFQYGGNTYIVQEKFGGTGNHDTFLNNQDFIVKIVGAVDLSTASFNATDGTLEIA